MLLLPGLINGHLHTWQTGLRGLAADWTVAEYMKAMHRGLATLFRPEDIYIANLMGALNQINSPQGQGAMSSGHPSAVRLLDHLVSEGEHLGRKLDAQRLCSLEVERQQ